MNYLMLICNDGVEASEAEESLVAETIGSHVAEIADIEIFGHPLQGPATARTVRVRADQTLVSDGPFVETKEHIAGFALLDCETREQAIRAAASHPLVWFNKIEVRPLAETALWSAEVVERLKNGPDAGNERYMLLMLSDGVPTQVQRELLDTELSAWIERMTASGALVAGCQLAGADAALMVRVRGPHTLVSQEPFTETAEFVTGFKVIDCSGIDEAIAIAASHPASRLHGIEVRPFTPAMCGEEPSDDRQLEAARSPGL